MTRSPHCSSVIHEDGCPSLAWMPDEFGGCVCDCHEQIKNCNDCGNEFNIDDLDDDGYCPDCELLP